MVVQDLQLVNYLRKTQGYNHKGAEWYESYTE